jgi:hypothetical protein
MHNQAVTVTTQALMTWREDGEAGLVGYVADGSVPLFTVTWTTDINDIGNGQSMLVRSTLPGLDHQVLRAGTFEDAKSLAERILAGWHERVFGPLEY